MLIEYSKLTGAPVFSLEDQNRVAELDGFFIDEDDGKIEVLIARTPGLFKKMKFIPTKEVEEMLKDALIIRDSESLVDPNEMVRYNKKLKKRARIIGERVVTKSGDYIGKVNDFVIESKSLVVTRLYVRRIFDQRIIHSSAILKIERDKIVIKDKFEMTKPEIAPIGAKPETA